MTFRDSVSIAFQNLWTQKIRTFLTVSGVIIAIATFVAMLAFGLGMQKNITNEIENTGILNTIQVTPQNDVSEEDSIKVAVLDSAALASMEQIDGVKLAYPFSSFKLTVQTKDTTIKTEALSLPEIAAESDLFSNLIAGNPYFSKGDIIISEKFSEDLGFDDPHGAIGEELVVEVKVANMDSAFSYATRRLLNPIRLLSYLNLDSLGTPQLLRTRMQAEVQEVFSRFLHGYFQRRESIHDTLTVQGVIGKTKARHFGLKPLIVPIPNAQKLQFGGTSDDPISMFSAIREGTFFAEGINSTDSTYASVTLEMESDASYETIKAKIEEMGFKAFSVAEELKQMRNFFIFFDFALGIIGFIALLVASLGIANTMIMSIVERRKEIGVFKSLGATNSQIKGLFLMETSVIGFVGSVLGLGLGWIILKIAKLVLEAYLGSKDVDVAIEFGVPLSLIAGSIAFGVIVSIIAGLYPASKAANVDPVESLRGE